MGKSLVIVESPSKATIINRYLGDDYVVRASVGHIRDLANGSSSKAETADGKKVKLTKEETLVKNMGIAEGEQIGRSKEKTEFVKKLSNKFSIEQIAEMLEIDISEVEKIIKEIAK